MFKDVPKAFINAAVKPFQKMIQKEDRHVKAR